MRTVLRLSFAGAVVVALAVAPGDARADGPRIVDRIVAIVDHQPILASEMMARAAPDFLRAKAQGGQDAMEAASAAILRSAVEQLVDEVLVQDAATKRQIVVSEQEVDRAGDAQQKALGFPDKAAFLAAAAEQGVDEVTYRRRIRAQIVEYKLFADDFAAAREHITAAAIAERLTELRAKNPRATESEAKSALEDQSFETVRQKRLAELRSAHYVELRL